MLVFLALGDAKVLFLALGDAKVPNARSFAFWWNIGFSLVVLMYLTPQLSKWCSHWPGEINLGVFSLCHWANFDPL